jgi:hypothetical protein
MAQCLTVDMLNAMEGRCVTLAQVLTTMRLRRVAALLSSTSVGCRCDGRAFPCAVRYMFWLSVGPARKMTSRQLMKMGPNSAHLFHTRRPASSSSGLPVRLLASLACLNAFKDTNGFGALLTSTSASWRACIVGSLMSTATTLEAVAAAFDGLLPARPVQ